MHRFTEKSIIVALASISVLFLILMGILFSIPSIDVHVYETLTVENGILHGTMLFFSSLAEPVIALSLIIFVLALLAYRRAFIPLVFAVISFSGASFLSGILKEIFRRARPAFFEKGFSFPSGHMTGAVIIYGTIAILLWKRSKKIALGILVIPVLVGISRVMLGMHWLSDVVGGVFFGSAWLLLCYTIAYFGVRKIDTQTEFFKSRKI